MLYAENVHKDQISTTVWRQSTPKSKCLVIINKGAGALPIKRQPGAWDLLDIFFMKKDIEAAKENPNFSSAEHVVFETDRNMRKFAIIKRVFAQYPILGSYDFFMLLDDDLLPIGCSIADMFSLFRETGLRLGQPALTRDSYFAHGVLRQNKKFRCRKINFVEVMCPIMSKAALEDYMPIFDATTGFGLDVYWSDLEWRKHGGMAVLDETPMRHTRPVGGGIAYQGITPAEESLAFYEKHQLKQNYLRLTLGGELTKSGIRL